MTQRLRTTIKYLFSIVLTIAFLYLAFNGTDFPKLWEILSGINYWWALALFPILILSHIFRVLRWEYFLRPVKKDLRFRNLFSAIMVGYMMNNILPRAGELVRPYTIGKLEGISRSTAFGTVLMERIFDVLSFMSLIALIPLVYSGPLTQTFPWLEQTGLWITVITFAFLGLFVFFMLRRDILVRILDYITRHLSPKRAQLIERIMHSFLDGFLFLKEPKHYLMIVILSILVWGLYIVMMYVPFYAFGLTEQYSLDLTSALVVQAISSIGFAIPTPGATGSYHYFTIQTLTKLYGVDQEIARSYATVTHAIGFIGITLFGIYYFLRDKLHMAEVMKEELPEKQLSTDTSHAS
ncbi:MAG: flippase-like domain-containing protein [Ignavibacteriae bacterium]|nr:flippase-like domain-containing protein [Ignavibacteriota bacterium]